MDRSTPKRLAVLVLGTGLIAILPANAAADQLAGAAGKKRAKAKVTLVPTPFSLPGGMSDDKADALSTCPERTTLLSGGVLSNTPEPAGPPELDTDIYKSGPTGNGWFVRYDNDSQSALRPSVQAVCLKNRLKVRGTGGNPKAITKVRRVHVAFTVPSEAPATNNGHVAIDVVCPKKTMIAGGGASFPAAASSVDVALEESGPLGNGWRIRYGNQDIPSEPATASALCLKRKLKIKKDEGKDKARSKLKRVDRVVTLRPEGTFLGRTRFTVPCPRKTTIVGGGGRLSPAAPLATTNIQLEESGAVGNAWQVTFDNDETVAQSATVHALCLKNKLKVK